MKARLLLLPLVAGPADVVVRPDALVRAVLAASQHLPAGTLVVPVPLAPRDGGPGVELRARAVIAAAYGATHLLVDPADAPDILSGGRNGSNGRNGRSSFPAADSHRVGREWAYDPRSKSGAAVADRAGSRAQ